MKNQLKKVMLMGVILSISTQILNGCASTTTTNTSAQDQDKQTLSTDKVTSNKLVIHDGCIGCGHCVRFAASNFKMNGRTAQVISQENIDSSAVKQAIQRCPAQVIELVEV